MTVIAIIPFFHLLSEFCRGLTLILNEINHWLEPCKILKKSFCFTLSKAYYLTNEEEKKDTELLNKSWKLKSINSGASLIIKDNQKSQFG